MIWLLKKQNIQNVYRPFKKKEYLLKRKELNVPINLKLNSELSNYWKDLRKTKLPLF